MIPVAESPHSPCAYLYPHLCECRRRRGAKALGYMYDARLRGLSEPAKAGVATVAEGFSPTAISLKGRVGDFSRPPGGPINLIVMR